MKDLPVGLDTSSEEVDACGDDPCVDHGIAFEVHTPYIVVGGQLHPCKQLFDDGAQRKGLRMTSAPTLTQVQYQAWGHPYVRGAASRILR